MSDHDVIRRTRKWRSLPFTSGPLSTRNELQPKTSRVPNNSLPHSTVWAAPRQRHRRSETSYTGLAPSWNMDVVECMVPKTSHLPATPLHAPTGYTTSASWLVRQPLEYLPRSHGQLAGAANLCGDWSPNQIMSRQLRDIGNGRQHLEQYLQQKGSRSSQAHMGNTSLPRRLLELS